MFAFRQRGSDDVLTWKVSLQGPPPPMLSQSCVGNCRRAPSNVDKKQKSKMKFKLGARVDQSPLAINIEGPGPCDDGLNIGGPSRNNDHCNFDHTSRQGA